jgi:hypothetical protein
VTRYLIIINKKSLHPVFPLPPNTPTKGIDWGVKAKRRRREGERGEGNKDLTMVKREINEN